MESDIAVKKPRERRLILGCGYLGRRVAAAWLRQNRRIPPNLPSNSSDSSDEGNVSSDGNMGDQVCDHRCGDTYDASYVGVEATVRTALAQSELQKDPALRGIPIHRMDVTQPETMAAVLHTPPTWQVLSSNFCLPTLSPHPFAPIPSRPTAAFQPWTTILWTIGFDATQAPQHTREDVYLGGLENLLRILDEAETAGKPLLAPHGRLLFCSSTGVYGDAAGQEVDEDSPCHPLHDGGRVLLAAERLLRSHRLGRRTTILRLAGLYGEGRVPRAEEIRCGKPLRHPNDFVNHIHVTDAVRVIQTLARSRRAETYLVTDDLPVTRRTFYSFFADICQLPEPIFVEETAKREPSTPERRGAGSKRASNHRLKSEYGLTLRYPTFREGLCEAQSDFSVKTD